jgi:hypothetical protein
MEKIQEQLMVQILVQDRFPYTCVNDHPNGATHVRPNGATLKWQNKGSRRVFNLAFFTPFRNCIFFGFFGV